MIELAPIQRAARQALPHFLSDLQMLVELETPSSEGEQLRPAAEHIAGWLELMPGFETELRRHPGYAPTIVANRAGTSPHRVLLIGHYDTVWPKGTLHDIPFSVVDGVIRGPGVLDMKAGIATLVQALRVLDQLGTRQPTLTVVLNGDEELGSPASRSVLFQQAIGSVATLVLEPGVGWDIKAERKGTGVFTLDVDGVEAHAGNDPERGISAIHSLATAVLALSKAAALEAGTSVNVGTIRGGTARNTVAGHAEALVDVRVTADEEVQRMDRLFASLPDIAAPATLRVGGGWTRPPMEKTPQNTNLLATAQRIATEFRAPLGERAVGGGSDGNLLSARGHAVLDGLGASGGGPHARSEHVLMADAADRIALVAGIIATLAEDTEATGPCAGGPLRR